MSFKIGDKVFYFATWVSVIYCPLVLLGLGVFRTNEPRFFSQSALGLSFCPHFHHMK